MPNLTLSLSETAVGQFWRDGVMRTVDEIFNEALTLPKTSRVLLVKKLVETLDFDEDTTHIDETIQELWIEEAQRRIDEIRSGAVKAIPGEEALARVRQLLES